ncbi:MGDG synthase family glycosyltransferase [Paenibacillus cremeus]|nr:glycosyltransferase [Paenibacillus cremeus]
MGRRTRVLIITASYGDGHLQAARSLMQAFVAQGSEDVLVMDLMKEAHPVIHKISTTLYIQSMLISRFGLDYYGWSYYLTRNAKFDVGFNRYVNHFGLGKMEETLEQFRPDAVVSTFPFGVVPELCSRKGIPNYTVITDFTLHARWVHPAVDKYYVAAKELKMQLINKGIRPDRIEVSGIPIRKAFDQASQEKSELMPESPDPLILVLAGSYGVLGNVDDILESLLRIEGCRLAVVCGRNQKLEKKLRMKYKDAPEVEVLGFVEHIHELMKRCTCMVTKAGGLTLSEAIALKKPVFIYKPFAGQEKENALFLSSKGIAFISEQVKQLELQMEAFLAGKYDPSELESRLEELRKSSASALITEDIVLHTQERQLLFR